MSDKEPWYKKGLYEQIDAKARIDMIIDLLRSADEVATRDCDDIKAIGYLVIANAKLKNLLQVMGAE